MNRRLLLLLLVMMLLPGKANALCEERECRKCVERGCWFCGAEVLECVPIRVSCPNGSTSIYPPYTGHFCPPPPSPPPQPPTPESSNSIVVVIILAVIIIALVVVVVILLFVFLRRRHTTTPIGAGAAAANFERLRSAVEREEERIAEGQLEDAVQRGDIVVQRGHRNQNPPQDEGIIAAGPNPFLVGAEEEFRPDWSVFDQE